MICKNCNQQISDESAFCPYCGSAQTVAEQPAPQPEPQPIPQPAPQPAPQAQYQQQQYFPDPVAQLDTEVSSVKTLGIVALIGAFLCPLVSYICGGIGISKAKKLNGKLNQQQAQKLKSGKGLCTAGIIVHTIIVIISIILTVVFTIFAAKAAKTVYDEIKDNPNNFKYEYNIDDLPEEYQQYEKQIEDIIQ